MRVRSSADTSTTESAGTIHRQQLAEEQLRRLRQGQQPSTSAGGPAPQPAGGLSLGENPARFGLGMANLGRLARLSPMSDAGTGLVGSTLGRAVGVLNAVSGAQNFFGSESTPAERFKGAVELTSAAGGTTGLTGAAVSAAAAPGGGLAGSSVGAALGASAVGTAGALASAGLAGYGAGSLVAENTQIDENAGDALYDAAGPAPDWLIEASDYVFGS